MNPIDALLLGVVLVSAAVGVARGLVREVFGIVSLAASLLLAYVLGPALLAATAGPMAGPAAYLVACAAVFVIAVVGLAFVSRLLTRLLKALHLGTLDRSLGGLFGLARALLITTTALIVLVLVMDPEVPALRESVMLRAHAPVVEWVGTRIPHEGVRREFERRWARLSPDALLRTTEVAPGARGHSVGA